MALVRCYVYRHDTGRLPFWVYRGKSDPQVLFTTVFQEFLRYMGLCRKTCRLDTQIMENEYLENKFFSIDPKGNILLDFMTEKVSERHFFLYRPIQKKRH